MAAFYQRAGSVVTTGGREGAVTIVTSVSPPGGDVTEPVSAHTQRFVQAVWSLDRDLAYARHYPAVSWHRSFSRDGDGRSALGPVLREYLVSEAMAKLGVPTTRALAAVTTGEQVARLELLPGGVITRTAQSFVRVGTFEFFASRNNLDAVTRLADYVIEQQYPGCRDEPNPYHALFKAIIDRQAALIAQWMQFGFIHGVMNTDNMSIAGETIDYGPCAFMDTFHAERVYSSIDHYGRYAYNRQPDVMVWNLAQLATALLPVMEMERDAAIEVQVQPMPECRLSHRAVAHRR